MAPPAPRTGETAVCMPSGSGSGWGSWSRCSSARSRCTRSGRRFGTAWRSGSRSLPGSRWSTSRTRRWEPPGVAPLLTIGPLETILGLLGAAVLVFLGVRTLRSAFRVRLGDAAPAMSRARAFAVALSMTAANPLTIASWAAIFSAASAAGAASSFSGAVLLVVGVGLGSATWDVTLATATALVGRHVGERFLRVVDLVAGVALLFFGGVLAYSVVT